MYFKNAKYIITFKLYVTPASIHFENKAIEELLKCDYNIKITLLMAISSKG
jgi:hypothetical protein